MDEMFGIATIVRCSHDVGMATANNVWSMFVEALRQLTSG